jgi:hypothetical protein
MTSPPDTSTSGRKAESLTQIVTQAGFSIKTDHECDRIGPLNIVTISRDGKRTRRKARGYEEALMAAASARGVLFYED